MVALHYNSCGLPVTTKRASAGLISLLPKTYDPLASVSEHFGNKEHWGACLGGVTTIHGNGREHSFPVAPRAMALPAASSSCEAHLGHHVRNGMWVSMCCSCSARPGWALRGR